MRKPFSIGASDFEKIVPPGYRLVVWRLPFSRKFALTWWVDENGKLGRKAR